MKVKLPSAAVCVLAASWPAVVELHGPERAVAAFPLPVAVAVVENRAAGRADGRDVGGNRNDDRVSFSPETVTCNVVAAGGGMSVSRAVNANSPLPMSVTMVAMALPSPQSMVAE